MQLTATEACPHRPTTPRARTRAESCTHAAAVKLSNQKKRKKKKNKEEEEEEEETSSGLNLNSNVHQSEQLWAREKRGAEEEQKNKSAVRRGKEERQWECERRGQGVAIWCSWVQTNKMLPSLHNG